MLHREWTVEAAAAMSCQCMSTELTDFGARPMFPKNRMSIFRELMGTVKAEVQ